MYTVTITYRNGTVTRHTLSPWVETDLDAYRVAREIRDRKARHGATCYHVVRIQDVPVAPPARQGTPTAVAVARPVVIPCGTWQGSITDLAGR